MTIARTRVWAGGSLLTTLQMNRDVSGILDDLAGRDGAIQLEDGFDVAGSDGYILLPRRDGVSGLNLAEGGLIYDNDTNRLRVTDGTTYQTVRTEPINSANIAGIIGTTATTIAEGNHTHG